MILKKLLGMTRDFLDLRSCEAVDCFINGVDWNFNQRNLNPIDRPATIWLEKCLPFAGKNEIALAKMVIEAAPLLSWFSSYEEADFGPQIVEKLASVELVGPQGHFMSDEMRMGFFLLGADVFYPNHWHLSDEMFIPLTSQSLWSKDNGEFISRDSGEIIIHTSNEPHAVRTQNAPVLALWFWRGGDLWQKPEF